MPRRLLLAADIVLDVASTIGGVERQELEMMAAALQDRARLVAAREGLELDHSPEMDRLRPSIRRLAAALDPEADFRRDPLPL